MSDYYSYRSSRAATRYSKTPSTAVSLISTPHPQSEKKRTLHKSLSSKQSLLTSSLIAYANNLKVSIPNIAISWDHVNKRYNRIAISKKITQDKLKKYHKNDNAQNSIKDLIARVEFYESANNEMRESKEEIEKQIIRIKSRMAEKEILNKKDLLLTDRLLGLQDNLLKMKTAKEKLKNHLAEVQSVNAQVKAQGDEQKIRQEEISISLEDINLSKSFISNSRKNMKEHLKELTQTIKENKDFREILEKMKKDFNEIINKNIKKSQNIKKISDNLKAKLGVITLENKHLDKEKNYIKEKAKIIKDLTMKVSQATYEAKTHKKTDTNTRDSSRKTFGYNRK